MKNSDFCNIYDLEFSQASVTHLRLIELKVDFGNFVATGVGITQLIQIFADRKYTGVVKGITTHDWEEFSTQLNAVKDTTRMQVWNISNDAALSTRGKEYEFWKCMANASR